MKLTGIRKFILLGSLIASVALLSGCSVQSANTPAATTNTSNAAAIETVVSTDSAAAATASPTATPETVALKVFDAAELAKYNGQNGAAAYIAVSGKVYDVSDVPQWKGGSHFGRFQAGQDLTTEITTISPHGISKLDTVPIVGLYQP